MNIRTVSILVIAVSFLFTQISCQKRKARKTLEGDWNVVGYALNFDNSCGTEYGESIFYEYGGVHGEATFERKTFDLTYSFYTYYECASDTVRTYGGSYKVTSHDRQLLVLHTYQVEMDGSSWDLYFGSSGGAFIGGDRADGQDYVQLSRILPNGDSEQLDLVRQ